MSRPTPEQLKQWSVLLPSTNTVCEDGWDAEKVDGYGAELWEYLSTTLGCPQDLLQQLWTLRYLLWLWDSEREWTTGYFDRYYCVQSVWDDAHLKAYHQIESERDAP